MQADTFTACQRSEGIIQDVNGDLLQVLPSSGIARLCWLYCALAAAQADTSVNVKLIDNANGTALAVESASQKAGAAAQQLPDKDTPDRLWHFLPAEKGQYKIVNVNSAEILAASNGAVVQGPDNGDANRLWELVDIGGGTFTIRNAGSGIVLGSPGTVWRIVPAGPAYPDPMPVAGEAMVHDPSMVKVASGTYYLFGTHGGIRMQSSADRAHFTTAGPALSAMPAWVSTYNKGDLWAPDVSYHAGKYWLYYAASTFGKNASAIGLATSASAAPGDWKDQGIVYRSQPGDDFNAIDPGLAIDREGKWWLSFGSFWGGIQMIRIDPATGKQASNTTRYPLARRTASPAIEAAYIYPHARYYYLFVSFDRCCAGLRSTYHIAVGRASTITGPYFDRAGVAMSDGGGTIVLSSHGHIIGPGGQSVLHDAGGDLLVYHYYDGNANGRPMLGINRMVWDSGGWPRIN